ncbi:MAG: hypothetical protein ACXWMU_00905 [Candidatus Limnocylindrales bacterium]
MSVLDALTGGGVQWDVTLERSDLLPGRLAAGRVILRPAHELEIRGAVAALVATEQWQYRQTTSDGRGGTATRIVTRREELVRAPVQLLGPATLPAGSPTVLELRLPVPPLGPATFEGTVSRLTWELEVKLDVPGLDPSTSLPIRVLQPTGLLQAGAIDLPAFACYPSVDVAEGELQASLDLEPVPLCLGAPFRGVVTLAGGTAQRLKEIRLELAVAARATVSSGLEERILAWRGQLAGPGTYGGATQRLAFAGELPVTPCLPTSELPHGRAGVVLEVVLARSWARDAHLRRDVAVCSTLEL